MYYTPFFFYIYTLYLVQKKKLPRQEKLVNYVVYIQKRTARTESCVNDKDIEPYMEVGVWGS